MTTRIISIQGAMASGKTTLVKALEATYPELHVYYENPYPIVQKRRELGLDIQTEDGFVENQRLFIQAELDRFQTFPEGAIVLDRGPEDLEFYTLHYPIVQGFNWDIETRLQQELTALRACRSNLILYLQTNNAVLRARRLLDKSKRRQSFEQHEPLWSLEENWYEPFPLIRIQTTDKSLEDVRMEAVHHLRTEKILYRNVRHEKPLTQSRFK